MLHDWPEWEKLLHEYEDATTTHIQLEGRLLSAVLEHDRDSIQSLKAEVETAWKLRTSLRTAIRDHRAATSQVLPGKQPIGPLVSGLTRPTARTVNRY